MEVDAISNGSDQLLDVGEAWPQVRGDEERHAGVCRQIAICHNALLIFGLQTVPLLAMVIGFVAWIHKDHIRIAGGAVSFGLIALAWQYAMVGVTIAVAGLVLAMFMA